ncbi:hypothetical protein [Actinomadura sp. SCN-SB]|uniref:hypothetical protein n=1 Tax=Actinomadura sp. SCN-SB TaxID=3373092 RepID=UPI003752AFAD
MAATLTAAAAGAELAGDLRALLDRREPATLEELRGLADELTTLLRRTRGRITRLAKATAPKAEPEVKPAVKPDAKPAEPASPRPHAATAERENGSTDGRRLRGVRLSGLHVLHELRRRPRLPDRQAGRLGMPVHLLLDRPTVKPEPTPAPRQARGDRHGDHSYPVRPDGSPQPQCRPPGRLPVRVHGAGRPGVQQPEPRDIAGRAPAPVREDRAREGLERPIRRPTRRVSTVRYVLTALAVVCSTLYGRTARTARRAVTATGRRVSALGRRVHRRLSGRVPSSRAPE